MIRLHYWPTPNGHKVTMFLEETGLGYDIVPVNIGAGDQFKPEFLRISPNNRMPAIEDTDHGVHVFESGAILLYLADRHKAFIPPVGGDAQARVEVLQWLFWQVGGLGPMAGQANHFRSYAPEKLPYAITRYTNETLRLLSVMDKRLGDRPYLAGNEYSIADMASYPWVEAALKLHVDGADLPALGRWVEAIAERPATQRAYAIAGRAEFQTGPRTEEQNKMLFQQDASTVRR